MKRITIKRLLLVGAIFSLFITYSCEQEEMWYDNQYLFLEQHHNEHSELLSGFIGHIAVDFPTYRFDSSTGILQDFGANVSMSKSVKMVLGTGSSLSGDAGSGAGTSIKSTDRFPFEHRRFVIENVDPDGTAYFYYKDSLMVLAPNAEWVDVSTEIVHYINNGDTLSSVKYTRTDRITNWGLQFKDDFVETDENW